MADQETGPRANVDPRNDEPVDPRTLPVSREIISQYLTNLFRCIRLIRRTFLILYPNQPDHPPGRCAGYLYPSPSTGCDVKHLQHAKSQAERLSMIALLLRTMEVIRNIDQVYGGNVQRLEKHFHHGLAYLNFMILGVLGNRCIQDILDLLPLVEKHDGKCHVCSWEVDSLIEKPMNMPIMFLLVYYAHTCTGCSRQLSEVQRLKKRLAIDPKAIENNPDVVNSCRHCENMLLDIFFHTELISFANCNIRMMCSLQITLNPAAIDSQDFKEAIRTKKRQHYYSPSKDVHEVLFLSGWREEKDEKDVLVKILLEQRGSRAFTINDRYQTLKQGEKCCCEDQALRSVREIPEFIFKKCTSVRLVLESAPCRNCSLYVLPQMENFLNKILPNKLFIHKSPPHLRSHNLRSFQTKYTVKHQKSPFAIYALLKYIPHSTYPNRLYAPTDPCDRLNGGTILLRGENHHDRRFWCFQRNCQRTHCSPNNCIYTQYLNILEVTHIISFNYTRTIWFNLLRT